MSFVLVLGFLKSYVIPFIVGGGSLFGFLKIREKRKTKEVEKESSIIELMDSFSKSNDKLVEALENNNTLIKKLITKFDKVNEKILIKDENQANIIKSAIFDRFAGSWIKEMLQIYRDNHLDNKDNTMKKIKSQTYIQLKYTCDKCEVIDGLSNYMPKIEEVLDIINDNNVYEKVYSLMVETKNTKDLNHFKTELNALYEVVLADIEVL